MVIHYFVTNFENMEIEQINKINYFTNSALATRNVEVKLNKIKKN